MHTIEVVIPAYNAERFLREAVESCLQSEVRRVWVVDDKSPDGTLTVARDLGDEHGDRIGVVALHENMGQYAACNTLLAYLKDNTSYVMPSLIGFLDSDDIATGDRFRATRAAFEADDALQVFSGQMETIDEEGRKTKASYDSLPEDPSIILARESKHVLINGVMTIRSDVLDILGGYEAASGGADTEFIVRAFYAGLKMRNTKQVLGYRRVHRAQCTSHTGTDPERAAYRTRIAGSWTWWKALKARGRLRQKHLRIAPVTADKFTVHRFRDRD